MKTICHYLLACQHRSNIAVRYNKSGQWTEISWEEYFRTTEILAAGLASHGVQAGDKVAIWCNTRVEWAWADMAALGLGAITVPIYQSSLPEDLEYILNNSEAKVLFCEDQ